MRILLAILLVSSTSVAAPVLSTLRLPVLPSNKTFFSDKSATNGVCIAMGFEFGLEDSMESDYFRYSEVVEKDRILNFLTSGFAGTSFGYAERTDRNYRGLVANELGEISQTSKGKIVTKIVCGKDE